MTASSLFRSASLISLAYVVSRFMGYLREAMLAARFGATHITDAYLVAQEIPNALFAAVSVALLMVFIPVYRETVHKRGAEAGWRLLSTVLTATLVLAAALALLGTLAAPSLVPALVPGLPAEVQDLAVALTRVTMPTMLFLAAGGVCAGVLNANRHFAAPAFAPLISNVVLLGTLFLVTRPEQIFWVAWGSVGGVAAGALLQASQVPRLGYRYRFGLDWSDPALAQMGRLILPVSLSATAAQLQNIADRFMASHLAEGSISALNYAVRLNSLPYGVIGAAIATVLYPMLAESAAAGRRDELRETMANGLRTLSYVLLPMALGLLAFREPIVRFFFQRGAFDPAATAMTAYALGFYAVGILFFGWYDFMNRGFFALQDSITPMWIGLGMVGLNIVLNLVLVGPFAIGGLALGTSLSTALAVGVQMWRLQARMGSMGGVGLVRAVLGNVLTAALGTATGYGLYAVMGEGGSTLLQLARLVAGLATVLAVHAGLGMLMGNREGTQLLARLRPRPRTDG